MDYRLKRSGIFYILDTLHTVERIACANLSLGSLLSRSVCYSSDHSSSVNTQFSSFADARIRIPFL